MELLEKERKGIIRRMDLVSTATQSSVAAKGDGWASEVETVVNSERGGRASSPRRAGILSRRLLGEAATCGTS